MGFNVVQAASVRPAFGLKNIGVFRLFDELFPKGYFETPEGKRLLSELEGQKDRFSPADGVSINVTKAPKSNGLNMWVKINNAMGSVERKFKQGQGFVGACVDGLFGKAGMIWRVLTETRQLIDEQKLGGRYY